MLSYHGDHGKLPPAVVYGKNGQPLYSWRVLLLPYLEEGELYQAFHLDEPWDSPHNIQLLARMPVSYAPPRSKAPRVPAYHTYCRVFAGPGTAFEDPVGNTLASISDGTSNTLLVVEAGEPVPWTMPEGLAYDPHGPLPDLTGPFHDGFRVTFADGSRGFIPKDVGEATLRALITRNGGELVGRDEISR
jgi:Protein of unknown function (DUF1559)